LPPSSARGRLVIASDRPAGTTLRCAVGYRPASAEEIAAAWRRLDGAAGFYFGGDAGIAGMHPAAGLLVVDPALALRVFADGVEVEARDAFGEALLAHPRLAGRRAPRRRASLRGASPRIESVGGRRVLARGALLRARHLAARCRRRVA